VCLPAEPTPSPHGLYRSRIQHYGSGDSANARDRRPQAACTCVTPRHVRQRVRHAHAFSLAYGFFFASAAAAASSSAEYEKISEKNLLSSSAFFASAA